MVRPSLFELLAISAWGLCVLPAVVSQAAPPGPSPTIEITRDGTCGSGRTCLGSGLGDCCSGHGFCGGDDAYCGTGCNPMFGTCNANNTVIPATTIRACGSANRTATVTVVSVSVAKSAVTVTAFATTTQVATATSVVTSVSKSISLYTVTSTRLVYTKSVSVYTTVSTKTVSAVSTVTVTATVQVPSPVTQTIGTSTTGPAPAPSPTLIGTSTNCKKYYKVEEGDTCDTVAVKERVTLLKLLNWNTALGRDNGDTAICNQRFLLPLTRGLCKVDCDDLWPGYYLCVKV